MVLVPRVVLVHRDSELTGLVNQHGTRGQVEFFLRSRGRSLATVQGSHDQLTESLKQVAAAINPAWRRGVVERADLHRFAFESEDLVAVVGPDGLVANVAKYLNGQPVIGIDPEPGRNAGVLVRQRDEGLAALFASLALGQVVTQQRVMVRASLDDGTSMDALNDIYFGDKGHQSARYGLALADGRNEQQASSGLIISTPTGATGWASSIGHDRGGWWRPEVDSSELAWFVREAWQSPVTGAELTSGIISAGEVELSVKSDSLVLFGDGLEADRLSAYWGQRVRLGLSPKRLVLVP
jgi:hypothetical protein